MKLNYSIGDKVKIVANNSSHGFMIGEVVTITGILGDRPSYSVSNGLKTYYVNDTEIELHKGETKMKTRYKDYSGCHPQIAEALKQGKEVYCKVWDEDGDIPQQRWVHNYISDYDCPYRTGSTGFAYAEPYAPTVKVKKASEIVKWLEDNGYKVDRDGGWENIPNQCFNSRMFYYCGKDKPEKYNWLPEWLEEV